MPGISEFFQDLDSRLQRRHASKLKLRLIGSAALMSLSGQAWNTDDADVLESLDLAPADKEKLLELAGPGTDIDKRHGLYLEFVSNGLPMLPQAPRFTEILKTLSLACLEVQALDVVDVVVSKLARFNARDVRDIRRMADAGFLQQPKLLERFISAMSMMELDARADRIPTYVKNLHTVERDILLQPESPIDIPDSSNL